MSMKNLLTLAGIEPATFRFVAQHLNHCATAVPKLQFPILFNIPVTIDAKLGYLEQRTDKAAVWKADKTRYESKLQQEFLPRCKSLGNTWFHTDVYRTGKLRFSPDINLRWFQADEPPPPLVKAKMCGTIPPLIHLMFHAIIYLVKNTNYISIQY